MAGAEHPGAAGVEPGGPGPDEYVRSLLREYGLRCTAARLAVVALFVDVESPEGHLTAAQIHARLVDQRRGVDLATVYRTVSTLVELGVLHALAVEENVTTYGLAAEPHHHAICSRCAAIIEVPAGRLSTALAQASLGSDFLLSETAGLTLHGLCPDCGPTRTD